MAVKHLYLCNRLNTAKLYIPGGRGAVQNAPAGDGLAGGAVGCAVLCADVVRVDVACVGGWSRRGACGGRVRAVLPIVCRGGDYAQHDARADLPSALGRVCVALCAVAGVRAPGEHVCVWAQQEPPLVRRDGGRPDAHVADAVQVAGAEPAAVLADGGAKGVCARHAVPGRAVAARASLCPRDAVPVGVRLAGERGAAVARVAQVRALVARAASLRAVGHCDDQHAAARGVRPQVDNQFRTQLHRASLELSDV